jgi:small-conductance mechanosensitive channel
MVVPNHLLVTSQVTNHSHPVKKARLQVEVPVSLSENVDAVKEVLTSVAGEHPQVLREPPSMVRFDAIATSHFHFLLIVWVDDPQKALRVTSELRFAIARAFTEHGIEFPTPPIGRFAALYFKSAASTRRR